MLCEDRYSGSFTPGPHESNQFLFALSLVLNSQKTNFEASRNEAYEHCQNILDFLSFNLDELARKGTMKYCAEFEIQPHPFFHSAPKNDIQSISHIKEISEARNKRLIEAYNKDCVYRASNAYKVLSNNIPWMKIARQLN